jgi:hypothetical protein
MTGFEVSPAVETGVPIAINRASPPGPYWDHPVNRIAPGEARMRFVRFFDWDELGPRDFEYLQVRLAEFPAHRDLVGRYALVEFEYARVHLIELARGP